MIKLRKRDEISSTRVNAPHRFLSPKNGWLYQNMSHAKSRTARKKYRVPPILVGLLMCFYLSHGDVSFDKKRGKYSCNDRYFGRLVEEGG